MHDSNTICAYLSKLNLTIYMTMWYGSGMDFEYLKIPNGEGYLFIPRVGFYLNKTYTPRFFMCLIFKSGTHFQEHSIVIYHL